MRVRAYSTGRLWLSSMLALTALALPASAGDTQGGDSANLPRIQGVTGVQKATPEQPSTAVVNAAEVLRMAEAGVSAEVLKSYVENASTVQEPSPSDLITLKEHGVADEVTMALIQRSAKTRAPANANAAMASRFVEQLRAQNGSFNGHLNPESYEYFQYYYLYPRTLSSAYDRLYYGTPPSYRPPFWYGRPSWW